MTEEERKRKCIELCFEAQNMDATQYRRMMHDSTKRPWVGLTEEEVKECFKVTPDMHLPWHIYTRIEAKLKEKNT
jgi:hypothetical protein